MSKEGAMPPSSECCTSNGSENFTAEPKPADLQRKLYFLNEQLQIMARELPP